LLFILDDYVKNYRAYWGSLQRFGGGLLLASVAFRLAIGGHIRWRIAQKHLHFATLVIGEKSIIEAHEADVRKHADASGEVLAGWISTSGLKENAPCIGLPLLGTPKEIAHWASRLNIEDVVIALPPEEHYQLTPLLLDLEQLGLRIFMFPDTYGILSGMVRLDEHGVPLMEWHNEPMDSWQRNSKRIADVVLSAAALAFLTPLLLLVALLVSGSKGPILFRQNRLGRKGKVFQIIKFRTMIAGAEAQGPQLSSTNDARITPIGSFLRKYRIDELPQFWNVLVGDMSLVGPRPEREFYASQIIERAPQYRHIYKVRPGITSWGMVRYGYASSVDEMIRRMEYDLLYIENMSWHNDFKVLIYTAWTVLKGRGK
jgi:exopolysaccharide biosynthesis polyprenyl glycosylphosphotransferase